jgi:hypothetical protein
MTSLEPLFRIKEAAIGVLRAADAYRDAMNGAGHEGEPHNRDFWPGPLPNSGKLYDMSGDCSACAGAQYGTEITLSDSYGNLRVALGQPRKPWESEP